MATGALDANGIWQYGEDDLVSPLSDYENLGQASVSTRIGALAAGITTPPKITGAFTIDGNFVMDPSIKSSLTKVGGRWQLVVGVNNKNAGTFNPGWATIGTLDPAARIGSRIERVLAAVNGAPWGYALLCDINLVTGAVQVYIPSTATIGTAGALTIAVAAGWDA